jgi:hypothetical protein
MKCDAFLIFSWWTNDTIVLSALNYIGNIENMMIFYNLEINMYLRDHLYANSMLKIKLVWNKVANDVKMLSRSENYDKFIEINSLALDGV